MKLMMNRTIRTRIPQLIKNPISSEVEEARIKDQQTRLDRKKNLDLRKTARIKDVAIGDKVLVSQRKSTTKPPYDPRPFEVTEIKGTQVTAERGNKKRVRNLGKVKVLRPRPEHLKLKMKH